MTTGLVTVVNCNSSMKYSCRVRVPKKGLQTTPALGEVTGITLRLSATETGAAINPAVDNLAMTEDPGQPGLFTVDVSQALHQTYLLPLGVGSLYYGIYKKTGDADNETKTFQVDDRTRL